MRNNTLRWILIGAAVVLILGLGAFLIFRGGGGADGAQSELTQAEKLRENKITLARDYLDNGEYQRALDLVDEVLIADVNDEAAQDLKQRILAAKKQAEAEAAKAAERDGDGAEDEAAARQAEAEARAREAEARRKEAELAIQQELEEQRRADEERRRQEEEQRQREEEERMAQLDEQERQREQTIQKLIEDGNDALNSERYRRARSAFEEVLDVQLRNEQQMNRYHAEALSRLARSYYEEDSEDSQNRQQAIQYANRAIRMDDSLWEPHFTLGQVYRETDLLEDAIDEFKKAARLNPDNAAIFYELGNAQFRAGRYREARGSYESCVDIDPYYRNSYYNLATTFLRLDQNNKALEAYRFAARVRDDARAEYQIGNILLGQGDMQGAVDRFKTAASLEPTEGRYHARLGTAYYRQGKLDLAESAFAEAAKLEGDSAGNNYNLALVKHELDKSQEALQYAERAIDINSDPPEYHYTLGQIHEKLGNTDKAIQAFSTAISKDGQYVKALVELGRVLDDQGMYDQALEFLLAAYRVEPNSLEVNNNLGNVYLEKELYGEAVSHLQRAIEKKPNDTLMRYNLALAYTGAEEFTAAREALSELLKIDNTFWRGYEKLGEVLIAQEDREGAAQILERLLERKPDYENRSKVEQMLANM